MTLQKLLTAVQLTLFTLLLPADGFIDANDAIEVKPHSLIQISSSQARSLPSSGDSSPTAAFNWKEPSNMKEQFLTMLENSLTGTLTAEAGSCDPTSPGGCSKVNPYNEQMRTRGLDWPPYGQTMVGHLRLKNVRMVIEETLKDNVPGDFAELGVWRGGTCIYAKTLYNLEGQTTRKVHLFDAFGALPGYQNAAELLSVNVSQVQQNFRKYGSLDDNVKFHKGLFKTTVPAFVQKHPDAQISVLRIDGNFYDSYQDALYYLYPKVPVGGFVIFDDVYVHSVPKKGIIGRVEQCWHDFKADNGLPETLIPIDDCSAYFRKTQNVEIDLKRMRPPQDANLEETQ